MLMEKKNPRRFNWYLPLYKASLKGDWESAREFFNQDPEAVTTKITHVLEIALHISVGTVKALNFVKELLELIPPEPLQTLQDRAGHTALHCATIFGNVEAAKLLVNKSPVLTNSSSNNGLLPIHLAAGYANKDVVSYLLTCTRDDIQPHPFTDESGAELLNLMIIAEFYGLAITKSPSGETALSMITRKNLSVSTRSSVKIWETFVYSCMPVKFWNLYEHPKRKYTNNPDAGCQLCARIYCYLRKLNFSGANFPPSIFSWFPIKWQGVESCRKHSGKSL